MNEKRKRGTPFPEGFDAAEAKLIGPYPTWRSWRHKLTNELGITFGKETNSFVEETLHRFYVIRRLCQKKGKIDKTDKEELLDFWGQVEGTMEDFEKKYEYAIKFIVENTQKNIKR